MTRDKQKQRVYSAEWDVRQQITMAGDAGQIEVYGSVLVAPKEINFSALEHVQTYVDRLLARLEEATTVNVRQGRSDLRKQAYATGRTITLPHRHDEGIWAWRELVILHEVAHTLTPGHGHDGVFASTYLRLVEAAMGYEAAFLLRVSMHEHNVDIAA